MKTVEASEAKTRFSELLTRVSKGERIRITRGIPIANLVPCGERGTKDLKEVVREIRQIRRGAKLGSGTLRRLVDDGRRY